MKDKLNGNPAHWTQQKEKAGYRRLKLLLVMFRFFPVVILRILAFPVGFFYFLFSKNTREVSRLFLSRAASFIAEGETAKKCRSPLGPLRHIISFSLNMVEKIETWGGKYRRNNLHYQEDDDVKELIEELESGKGSFLLMSHLGNMEIMRALVSFDQTAVSRKISVTAIMNVEISSHYTRMIKELNQQSSFDVINVNELGPQSAALLEEKLAAGEMITSAGDRTPAAGTEKNLFIPFLGEEAPFGLGIFYLALLLNVPLYFVFALRRKDLSLKPEYDVHVHKYFLPAKFSTDCNGAGNLRRKERIEVSNDLARSFAGHLERYCKEHPFQWYNFYDFWQKG